MVFSEYKKAYEISCEGVSYVLDGVWGNTSVKNRRALAGIIRTAKFMSEICNCLTLLDI